MDEACWLSSHWGEPENNRRAKYYCLSKRQLKTETDEWKKVVLAMADALKAT
jgi:PadR family transcriptional regulator, regulatory protein PadR